jgi:hypothetical protein
LSNSLTNKLHSGTPPTLSCNTLPASMQARTETKPPQERKCSVMRLKAGLWEAMLP